MSSTLTRKNFLNLAAQVSGAALVGLIPSRFGSIALADQNSSDTLVYVFLRGGCDGLNFIPPISGEDRQIYEQERPGIKMPLETLLKLNDRHGLHPGAKPLFELYEQKKLAFVHAAGLTINNRSHFDAQNFVELGTPDKKTTGSGWLTRHLESLNLPEFNDINRLPALSIGSLNSTSLLSYARALSVSDLHRINLTGDKALQTDQRQALKSLYQNQNTWLHRAGVQALNALDLIENKHPENDNVSPGVEYPHCDIGNRLKTLATVLKMDLGVQVATIDMGGWDTHKYQGAGNDGPFAKQVEQLSGSLSSFYRDLNGSQTGALGKRTTIVVMTEFGRRLRENANRGTDHGHGGVMMVLGEHVVGGHVYGQWPGLRTDQLYERADLAVTTDFRQVLAEVVMKRLKNNKVGAVFPGFKNFVPLHILQA